MLFTDSYFTIDTPSQGNFRDRGSKFLAYAFPVFTEQEIKDRLAEIKKEHPSATHHCYAFILGADKSAYRANDDGEPSGSAGRPIYNTLLSNDLTNILVIVVRYFGGTQLGIPGLINAYKCATAEAINAAQKVERTVQEVYSVAFDYLNMNEVMRLVKQNDLSIIKQDAGERAILTISIRKSVADTLLELFKKIPKLEVKYLQTI